MKNLEGEFKGVKDTKIYYQSWLPDNPKAVVQLVHGFREHSGRYMNVVNALVPRNYAIYADDHRGHGKSEGIRGYVDSFDQYIEDEKLLHDIIKERHSNLPIFLLGHSMGSVIATHYVRKYEDLLKGLVLSGLGTKPGGSASILLKLMSKLMSKIKPNYRADPGLDTEFISRDPEVVKAYENDPMIFWDISARLGAELMKRIPALKKFGGDFKLPLLIQCGTADTAMLGHEDFEDLFTMEDKTIKFYEGLFHEVYNELEEDRKVVLKDLGDWLDNHL